MNTQATRMTIRGRAIIDPKRFTPSSMSPPPLTQTTNRSSIAFNVTRKMQPNKRSMITNHVRSPLSSLVNQMNIDNDDDDTDEANDDQPPRKVQRTVSRSQLDEQENDADEASQESTEDNSEQADEEETTTDENNAASQISFESTPANGENTLYQLIHKDISGFCTKLNYSLNTSMKRFEKKFQRLAAACLSTKTASIDQFKSSSNEEFESVVDHNGINLLEIYAKDYGAYAREILRVLYRSDELKSSILPSSYNHFSRKQLDRETFQKFHRAVRNKYRISKSKYDEFFKICLRRKLVDFLCDERKRFKKKQRIHEQEQQIFNSNNNSVNPTTTTTTNGNNND
ncbi:unnamed protein product [Rotaria magnacalcarata]|uniref:Uncharacterized protein n=1 Tax=Rotaria magnacalcarata TaxID=392030 RepID=A0A816WTZ3_9BILA|nr:unnamed protein product [Rotaria magnacalcarata]CAF2138449.1 unnamed protein product [Rotaria magnacalcarata]